MFINNNDVEYIRSILQNSEEWITVKGNHIKLKDGETAKEATQRFIEEKQNKQKGSKVTGYKEYDPENAVKFIKPSFTISEDRKETIKNFKTWYKENLQGKSVENPLLGKVYFYSSGMEETKHRNLRDIENLKYISIVPEIIKTSKDIEKEELKHDKKDVKCAYRIKGFVDNDENIKKISIVILEDSKGNRFYTFDIRKREEQADTPAKTGAERLPTENSTMLYHENQNVNGNRFYTFDIRKEIFSVDSASKKALNTSIDETIINNNNLVNSFELNLYVTETDFRMFEINF